MSRLKRNTRFAAVAVITSYLCARGAFASDCPPRLTLMDTDNIEFGSAVSALGDVDQDGFPDFIVGYPGRAGVYSGRTGNLYWAAWPSGSFGYSVASAGDFDADGVDDWIVGAPTMDSYTGRAFVYSGRDRSQLRTLYNHVSYEAMGTSVSGAGDVNADGYDDVIVGAPGPQAIHDPYGEWPDTSCVGCHGHAYVFSGFDGSVIWALEGESVGDLFGSCVASAGDADQDGFADVVVGAPGSDVGGSRAGRAYVFSGRTGSVLWSVTGRTVFDYLGDKLANAGDVDADGVSDLLIAAPISNLAFAAGGMVYIYSGKSHALLWQYAGGADDQWLGQAVAGVGDLNHDGFADFAITRTENSEVGVVGVFSGRTGLALTTLSTLSTGVAKQRFGASIAAPGDMDGDGIVDLVVGAPVEGSCLVEAQVLVYSCPTVCACDCNSDPVNCDGVRNISDVVQTIDVAFRGIDPASDPNVDCPTEPTDLDCSGDTGVVDVVKMINVAIRGASADSLLCAPCP